MEEVVAGSGFGDSAGGASGSGAAENPWPPGTAYITTASLAVPAVMGLYALLKKGPRRLPLFVSLWVAIGTVVRQLVCCRCEYYGTECSTLMGLWTARILPRDEEGSLAPEAFQLDFLLIGASVAYPLPQVKAMGGRYLAAYLASVVSGAAVLRALGCSRCPNTVCFMNPAHRGGGGEQAG